MVTVMAGIPLQAQAQPLGSVIYSYNFEEGTALVDEVTADVNPVDQSFNNYTATVAGDWLFHQADVPTGGGNYSLTFPGRNGQEVGVDAAAGATELLGDHDWTLSFDMNYLSTGTPSRQWIMTVGPTTGSAGEYLHWLIQNNTGSDIAEFGFAGGTQNFFNISAYAGQWVRVVTTYNATTRLLTTFINGELKDQDTVTGTIALSTNELALGKTSPGNAIEYGYKGSLDNIELLDYVNAPAYLPTGTVVTTAEETGVGSLRQAITEAIAGDTITFASNLSGATINLTSPLVLDKDININGSSLVLPVALNAPSLNILEVSAGRTVTLDSLIFASGAWAIKNYGHLTVLRSTFGSGIYSLTNSNLEVSGSTFSGCNSPLWSTIYSEARSLTVINSTFSNNLGNYTIYARPFSPIDAITLRNNTFDRSNGLEVYGVYLRGMGTGNVSLYNNIFANMSSGFDCYNRDTILVASVGNLWTTSLSCGNPAVTGNPNLGPLQDNGGPTKTMALLAGSPAIDAGDTASSPATDQRGVTRPQGAQADIGAFETIVLSTTDLTVDLAGNGSGSVSDDLAGISCGSDCNESYILGTTVTLTATPATGSTFSCWSGACNGTSFCEVTLDAVSNVTATFTLDTFTLYVSSVGNGSVSSDLGSISCGLTCDDLYDYGTLVTLTASPDAGYGFTGWSGACIGTGTCEVTMDAAKDVTASFSDLPPAPRSSWVVVPTESISAKYRISWARTSLLTATYRIEISSDGGNNYAFFANTSNSWYDVNGQASGDYIYRVITTNAGYSESIPKVSGPISVSLSCANIGAFNLPTSSSTGAYRLGWTRSATPGVEYVVSESFNGGAYLPVTTISSNYLKFAWKPNGTYRYQVQVTKNGYASSAVATSPTMTVAR